MLDFNHPRILDHFGHPFSACSTALILVNPKRPALFSWPAKVSRYYSNTPCFSSLFKTGNQISDPALGALIFNRHSQGFGLSNDHHQLFTTGDAGIE